MLPQATYKVIIPSSTSIQVSWVAPSAADQNGAVTVYTVYYQAVGANIHNGTLKQQAVVAPLNESSVDRARGVRGIQHQCVGFD